MQAQDIFRPGLMEGRTAYVAGGTSGINWGIAARFAQLGARVVVVGRDAERAAAAAARIGPTDRALGLAADVRDAAAVRASQEATVAAFGPIDIVIAGAAGNFLAPATGMSANGFRTVVDIDLMGTFNVFRQGHDLLRAPGASLIAITAGLARRPKPMQAHACAAKAGVDQLVRVLAMEWGGAGIRVNAISPGPIEGTEGVRRMAPTPEARQGRMARIALHRYGEVSEIADCAVFLCSSAAAYITGAVIDCDGGHVLGDASQQDLAQGTA
jgi:NAD(P)-dependent dehydrogenase (short-subunit alcohol dehydrogenase family)